jgi:hypothetical protein
VSLSRRQLFAGAAATAVAAAVPQITRGFTVHGVDQFGETVVEHITRYRHVQYGPEYLLPPEDLNEAAIEDMMAQISDIAAGRRISPRPTSLAIRDDLWPQIEHDLAVRGQSLWKVNGRGVTLTLDPGAEYGDGLGIALRSTAHPRSR